MSPRYLDVVFESEEALIEGVRALRRVGYAPDDVYTPYAVHGLDEAAGFPPSRLGWICALGGVLGAGSILFFQIWTSAVAWPLNVGGKPFNSLPTFIPVTFEFAVLLAGLATVGAFLVRSGLRPGKAPQLPAPGVTNDRFLAAYAERDASFDAALVARIARQHGAVSTGVRGATEER